MAGHCRFNTLVLTTALLALVAAPASAQKAPTPASPTGSASMQTEPTKYLVFFDWDSAVLTEEARRVIASAADDFRRSGAVSLTATGFTDLSGSPQYNQKLSERRAQSVAREFIRLGVPASTITTIGKGESNPLVPTADGVRELRNRRVEIVIPKPLKPAEPPKPVAAAPVPPPPPPAPKWEVALGGFYGHEFDEKANLGGGALSVAYNVTPLFSVKVEQDGFNSWGSDDDGLGGRSVAGFALQRAYGAVTPYIGANAGGVYGDGVEDSVLVGPEIGIKVGFGERWFGYLRGGYDFLLQDVSWDEGIANAGIGVGYRF